jgi:AcrR family transcriptional regulator
MNKEDRRVKRTRRLLGQALVELTLEKGYEEVTIQEITDRADIGYRTYFRHYADKDALLRDVLGEMLAELQQLMILPSTATFDAFEPMPEENGLILFQHVQENSDLYRVFLSSGPVVMEPMMGSACRKAHGFFDAVPDSPIPLEIVANHVIASIFALIRWWLENGKPYPPHQMGEYAAKLIMVPSRQAILDQATKPSAVR